MLTTGYKTFLSCFILLAATSLPTVVEGLPSSRIQVTEVMRRRGSTLSPQTAPAGAAEQASLFVCQDYNWSGNCEIKYYTLGSNDCAALDGKASAVGPDKGFSCTFYKNGVCRDFSGSDALTLVWPGNNNLLDTEKGNFNDAILSYQCFLIAKNPGE